MTPLQIPVEKWAGKVTEVKLGGNGRKDITIGGENTLPFLHFEGTFPHQPALAIEIQDMEPDWPADLLLSWGDAVKDPGQWARKAAEYGADIVALRLRSAHPEVENSGAEKAKRTVASVLEAVDLPLIVLGPEVAEKDNEVLLAVSEIGRGQRLALGNCTDKNYRAIAASCLANEHVAIAKAPTDVNLSKQLNMLLHEAGLPMSSVLTDPTTGALGYGLEYTYSVVERLRLSCLSGDEMTSTPIICTVGEESWKQKESRSSQDIPESWGAQERRAIIWESITSAILATAGADIVVLRHPRSVELIKEMNGKWLSMT
ncbi:MAG: acetyl-CoA decarbonylase/synthase complex subunit delta [Dehalococcoidia bacterium]|nr:acetyl-CoA decarbonylase/synthase complex subunit delta [Dehalococcoidia bacterium]